MINFRISDSGIPVYHFFMPQAAICKTMIVAKCGSSHEDGDSWGVAHFLEHMCFQGTPSKNKHQVSREQALLGSYNAYTSNFSTAYHFDSLIEDFEKGLLLLKESVFDSNYPAADFEKEKSVISEEWRMYDNYPTEHFWEFVTVNCFGNEEGHPVIGTFDSIQNMDTEKLLRYRNKWYGRENMFMVVVGNIDFERVMAAANAILPNVPNVEKAKICLEKSLCEEDKYVMETDRFEQAALGMFSKSLSLKECIQQSYRPVFFDYALSKYLYEHIRDDLGLCYGVSISGFGHFENQYSIISLLTNNGFLEKAEIELENLFSKLKSDGFPSELFEICKKQQLYNKIKNLQSVGGVANTIVHGVTSSSEDGWFVNEGYKLLDIETMKIFAADLKPFDLQEVAQNHLNDFKKFIMISTKI